MEYFNCILVFLVFLGEGNFFYYENRQQKQKMKIIFFFIIYIWKFILKDIEGYEINYYDIFLKQFQFNLNYYSLCIYVFVIIEK